MANDDRRSEQFVREVDEELRRDQLKALWNRFAPVIIGACVLIVVITAGYRGFIWWQELRAARAGDRFMAALEEIESGDRARGEAELKAISEEGGRGYAALARLRLAGAQAASGDKAAGLQAYDAVANDTSVPGPLRSLASIRGALIALDIGDAAGAKERALPLNEPGNPWRHAAREILGTAAYESGELRQARDYFAEIQQDAESPADLWIRSGMMVSLIDGQLPAGGNPENAAEGEGEPAGGSDPASAPDSQNPTPEAEIPPQ